MTLLPNWHEILTKAWSVRFIALAGILETVGAIFQYFVDMGSISLTIHLLAVGLTSAAGVARIVAQRNLPDG